MTCRGGCIGGGGQPKANPITDEIRNARIKSLYHKDHHMTLRFSHENPEIKKTYTDFYHAPLSVLAEKLLHTTYLDRSNDLGPLGIIKTKTSVEAKPANLATSTKQYRCTICGYIHEGEMPDDFTCPLCGVPKDLFEEVKH